MSFHKKKLQTLEEMPGEWGKTFHTDHRPPVLRECRNPCPHAATCAALPKQAGCRAAAEMAGELSGARELLSSTAAPICAWHPAASAAFWVVPEGREQPECLSLLSKPLRGFDLFRRSFPPTCPPSLSPPHKWHLRETWGSS